MSTDYRYTISIWLKTVCLSLALWIIGCEATLAKADSSEENLARTYKKLQAHVFAEEFEQALPFAKQVAAIAHAANPFDPTNLAVSLHNLAIVQLKVGHYLESAASLKENIRIIEENHGPRSPILIRQLRYLASLYYQTQDYDYSLQALRRAQIITHQLEGVYNLEQLPMLNEITRVYLKTDKIDEANREQKFHYSVNLREYGEKDPRIVPAMARLGFWYRQTGQYRDALVMYSKVMRLIRKHEAAEEQLVSYLRAEASTLYLQGSRRAVIPLNHALNIVMNSKTADMEDKLEALLLTADMNLLKQQQETAAELYQEAWSLITLNELDDQDGWIAKHQFDAPTRLGVNKKEDVSDALPNSAGSYFASMTDRTRNISASQLDSLGTPVVSIKPRKRKERLVGSPLPLCSSHVLKLTRSGSVEELKKFRLQLDFSVAEDGQVRNVNIVESNAPVRLNVYVKNMLTSTRYRPRLENGSPTVTKQITMHQTFTNEGLLSDYEDSPLDASTTAIFQGCLQMAAMPDG